MPKLINFVRGLAYLTTESRLLAENATGFHSDSEMTDPDSEVSSELLEEMHKLIKESVEMVFSDMSFDDAMLDLISTTMEKAFEKIQKNKK